MGTTVLTVGEALISLTPIGGSSLQDAEQLYVSAAGAELNVAVHLARLGVPTRLASSVGDDPMGRRLRASLGRAGVDTTFLEADPVRHTAVYLKDPQAATAAVYYYRAGSAASAYREVPAAAWADVGHVHLSGITPALSAECLKLVDSLLSQREVPTSFDVNYRAALWPPKQAAPVLRELANRASIVLVGLDEAAAVWGTTTHDDVRRLLPEPAELVIKDGARNAVAFLGRDVYQEAARKVEVVEPVGAGDGFAAGYLAARLRGRGPQVALRWGHAVAASVVQGLGDHGPGISSDELELIDDDDRLHNASR
jgi:2-dehydro-3-deoxygluconokinase